MNAELGIVDRISIPLNRTERDCMGTYNCVGHPPDQIALIR